MKRDRLGKASMRWFRLMLRLYPADFRDEMGAALLETYRDRSQEAFKRGGPLALMLVWFAALRDSLLNGAGEHLRPAVAWRRTGDWGRDLELVSRRLRRRPLFLVAVLGTLTLGFGTFAVVYTAVDKILLEPLVYKDPQDLYMIWRKTEKFVLTGPEAAELRKGSAVTEPAAIMRWVNLTLPGNDRTDATRLAAMSVSPELFDVLRVHPMLGRGLRAEETGPNAPNVIVLSNSLWQRLGADPGIVGTEIKIAAEQFTVIGVMPPEFQFSASDTETIYAYLPLFDDLPAQPPLVGDWMALVRARHGVPSRLVQEEMDRVSLLVDERVNNGKRRGLRALGLQADLVAGVRPALLAMSFATVFLVLVLTVNLASLLLARAAEREKEFAVARALGASGPAVVRATLVEGALLGLIGASAGVMAGIWVTRILVALGPLDLPRRDSIVLDWPIAAVVIGAGLVLGFVAASVPAFWASRVSLPSLLAAASVRGFASTGRMRRGLIVVQVALSLVLLSAGGLVARSFQRLLAADPGFRPKGVVTFGVALGNWLYQEEHDSYEFQDRVTNALKAMPGVKRVSSTSTLPLSGGGSISWMYQPNQVPGGVAGYRVFVRAGYIETMGMRLISGRTFEEARHDDVHEALIDRQMARHFFGDRSPLGATLMCDDRVANIIGVVEQPRIESLHRDDTHPQMFLRAEDYSTRPWRFAVQMDGDPRALKAEILPLVRRIDSRVAVSDVQTMDEIVAERRSHERISALMITGLALGGLLLVAMGLFGVISGSVSRRRGELAVRMALGATRGRVLGLVIGEGARLIALGLLIGIPGIYMAGQALEGLLIGVSPFDLPTLSGVAGILIIIALLACYLGARHVVAIAPGHLLREVE